ncbi:MAG: hypothetical protein ACYTEL_16590 [Planctomycetota bacterium]|jgi:hypothetical protein
MGDTKSNDNDTSFGPIGVKGVVTFLCVFLLVYLLLMAPWPGLAAAYSSVYRAVGARLFKSYGSDGMVLFAPSKENEQEIRMLFYRRDRIGPDGLPVLLARIAHNTRRHGYMPTAFLIALVLTTPVGWKRRGWALLWAMIIIHAIIILRLWIWFVYGFSDARVSLLVLSPFWARVLALTVDFFLKNLSFRLIVCVFIWILVAFRRADWQRILAGNSAAAKSKPPPKNSKSARRPVLNCLGFLPFL